MYKAVALRLVNILHRSYPALDDKDMQEISAYGIELSLSTFVNYLSILLIGLITCKVMTVFVFAVVFNSMRKYIGGYHCTTYFHCNITFISIYVTILFLSEICSRFASISLIIMLLLISGFGVWNWGPVENHFKPVTQEQKKHCHTIAKTIYILDSLTAIVCYIWLPYYAWVIVISLLAVALLLPIGTAAERRRHYEI